MYVARSPNEYTALTTVVCFIVAGAAEGAGHLTFTHVGTVADQAAVLDAASSVQVVDIFDPGANS